MHRIALCVFFVAASTTCVVGDELPKPLAAGLKNPESVAVGPDGKVYVSQIGEFGKDGDGSVVLVNNGKILPFAKGLDDPKGLAVYGEFVFVTDKDRVLKIDKAGNVSPFAPANAFPSTPLFLNDIAIDPESGTVYVSDSGDLKGKGGVVYRISTKGLVEVVVDQKSFPKLHTPNGLALEGASHLLVLDFGSGELSRVRLVDRSVEKLADGFEGGDGLTWDRFGRLFISSWSQGKLWVIPRPGEKPVPLPYKFESAADTCLDRAGQLLLVPDMKAGTLTALPTQVPGQPVDDTALPLDTAPAFPRIKWEGWTGETPEGKIVPHRPIVLTHAGDGSNRIFLATQHGVIHVFPSDPNVASAPVFMDIQKKVRYDDKTNEEGFLGLAFHPNFKENGEYFAFYTLKDAKLTNVLSRFRVKKDDPSKGDPASEEVLLRIVRPFWNHDGGTIAFGPDGYLYVALGDGGAANDPYDHAQNLKTLLGSILRIDVNSKAEGKAYAIPKDNPLLGNKDACPEIWAYGLRNVWRFSFDRKTGQCWAADVGQNLYEEINLITAGGNYGWNRREGLHPFGARGVGPRKEYIDPIWEYHHDTGRSVTGGYVYRGEKHPELQGSYLYADYVSGRIWALRYDAKAGRVVANRPLKDRGTPILSFGEDEKGELYLLTFSPVGQGVLAIVPATKK